MNTYKCLVKLSVTKTVSTTTNVVVTCPQEAVQIQVSKVVVPLNPKNGDVIWGNLKVGMTAEEALQAVPNAKFDDHWSAGGVVGVMAEGGILANNKIKVGAEIIGPFNTPSNLYVLFDEAKVRWCCNSYT
jgi:hypothetical protein